MIRYSNENDIEEVKNLLYKCFGSMVEENQDNAYKNIERGRYLLYIEDNKIVALSGLCFGTDSEFNGIQITWTCTDPEYRHRGYMQELFKRIVSSTDEAIYCSCWYIGDNDINLKILMKLFNFKEVMPYLNRNIDHYCPHSLDCPYKKEHCYCGTKLYRRPEQYNIEDKL